MMVSCSRRDVRSQVSMVHADLARDEVRAAGQPVGAVVRTRTQTWASTSAVSRPEVGGAVLEAEQVARGAWARVVDDVRPKPSCDQRSDARPNAIRARLRTACTATCGSSAQA
jgi:hypothetical protein